MIPRYRIEYSPSVMRDITEIFTFIAADSPENAQAMTERILAKIDKLQFFPERLQVFSVRGRVRGVAYSLPVQPYMIYYQISEDDTTVRIARVRHGARRPLKRL